MADRNAKGQFISGNKYQFTSGDMGYHWRMMPSRNSAVWDSMITNMRSMSYRGVGTRGHHSVFSLNPSSINSRNIQWLLALNRAGTRSETRDALEEVGHYIATEVNSRIFDERGKQSTGAWPELTDATTKWRRLKGYPEGPILEMTGSLRDIATSDAAINEIKTGRNPRVIMGGANWPSGGEPGTYGANLMEKYFVHMGGSWSSLFNASIPARPFMPENEDDFTHHEENRIKEIFEEHIFNLIERA